MRQVERVLFSVVVLALSCWASFGDDGTAQDVESYLRAYIFQHEKIIDGEVATAAYVGNELRNGIDALSSFDPEVNRVVLRALQMDRATNATEYLARKHIANAESLRPDMPWSLDRVQRHLWSRFLGDARWLHRVKRAIKDEAQRTRTEIFLGSIPDSPELETTWLEIEEVVDRLATYQTPEGPACGANPRFAMRNATHCDPMLVADIYDMRGNDGLLPKVSSIGERLRHRGWTIELGASELATPEGKREAAMAQLHEVAQGSAESRRSAAHLPLD